MEDLDIAFGKNHKETSWRNEYLSWSEFVGRLRKVRVTPETMQQYADMTAPERDAIKDGPSYVGGLIRGGRRLAGAVESRSVLTLDCDFGTDDFLFDLDMNIWGWAYVVYSTHSYAPPNKLKYRLVMPTSRRMTPDEYAAISRKLAHQIGMAYWDKTTFDVNRLMYMPSRSIDNPGVFIEVPGEALDVDKFLKEEYLDWRDMSTWPAHPDELRVLGADRGKLEPLEEKTGIVGAFVQEYDLDYGLSEFLSDVYEPTSDDSRWTFIGGSSFGGLRVYPDGYAYSEHNTDPANDGRCHNLFDLVRIHRFGDMDEDKSQQAMLDFAANTKRVIRKLVPFEVIEDDTQLEAAPVDADDHDWRDDLTINTKTSSPYPTANNVELLLSNGVWDGVLAYDDFGNTEVIRKDLPWRSRKRPNKDYEPFLGADDKRMENWFSKKHLINNGRIIKNAFTEIVHQRSFHPIKEYLEAQAWDGVERAERIFHTYLGAEDTHYVRQTTRKILLAAVKRLYEPGCKFDQMLVLVGPQGAGKSSILAKLGRQWFSDSLRTFDNKEAGEHLQSGWIFEIGELSAMKKAEVEEVKAFLSKTEDRYRVAYDRQVSDFPRKCVFFGTTNTKDFLRDATGNRRFWPVGVNPSQARADHWTELPDSLVGQIWAEAVTWFRAGESLELDTEARLEAERQQAEHMEGDPISGIIQVWLDGNDNADKASAVFVPVERKEKVCAAMVWSECLNKDRGSMKPWDAKNLCDILRSLPGWEEGKRTRFDGYGQQTTFFRVMQ